jgi:hypothetical protein
MSSQLRISVSQSSYGLFLGRGGAVLFMPTFLFAASRKLEGGSGLSIDGAKVQPTGVSGPMDEKQS